VEGKYITCRDRWFKDWVVVCEVMPAHEGADALTIAAAPDMLGALQAMLAEQMDNTPGTRLARAAVALATGTPADTPPEPAQHASRTAPLCVNCVWHTDVGGRPSMCCHPSQPISPVTGSLHVTCRAARASKLACDAYGFSYCAPEGLLFQPIEAAPQKLSADSAAKPQTSRSVRCHLAGTRLEVHQLVHRVIDGAACTEEEGGIAITCSSEGLGHALRNAIEAFDHHDAHGALRVIAQVALHQVVDAALANGREPRVAVDRLPLAQPDQHVAPIDGGVKHHQDHALVRRQQAAEDLHRFLPICVSEGQRLKGLGNEIVFGLVP
jgi:hypothetical protein